MLLRPDGDPRARPARPGHERDLRPRARRARRQIGASRGPCSAAAASGATCAPTSSTWSSIDPDEVELPGWYRPNPGRASDVAVILFTGDGHRDPDGRSPTGGWRCPRSAPRPPPRSARRHRLQRHPAPPPVRAADEHRRRGRRRRPVRVRLGFDPATFWDEVAPLRRDASSPTRGRCCASWSSAARTRRAHHPVRMFIGSGMPRNLWRRVTGAVPARPRAGVLRLHRGRGDPRQPGRPGRARWAGRCPGTAEVRVAAVRPLTGRAGARRDGLRRECAVDEVGLLLARVRPTSRRRMSAARRVRERRRLALDRRPVPARRPRRPLARRATGRGGPDADGPVPRAIRTRSATSRASTSWSPTASRRRRRGRARVAAVTLRAGRELRPEGHRRRAGGLIARAAAADRPRRRLDPGHHVVPAVDSAATEGGDSRTGRGGQAWYRDARGESYRPVSERRTAARLARPV